MIDANTGILWARSYDRDASNNLAVENEVAQDVVQALALKLGGEESRVLATPPTQNPGAFDAYLRGKSLVVSFNNRGKEDDFSAAEEALRKAIQLDPQMAAAYGELAHLYFLHDVERVRTTTDPDRLRTVAAQALAIDPKQVAALDALAMMNTWIREDDTAYAYALKVLAVNPHDPGALMVLGVVYANTGLLEDALASFRKAGEAEPLYLYPMTNAAEMLVMMGRLEEAWQENEGAAAIEPDNYSVLQKRAWIRYHQGRLDDAEQIIKYARARISPAEGRGIELIQAWIYSRRGLHAQAQAILKDVKDSALVHKSLDFQMWLAEGWALENQPDKALPVLASVVASHPNYPWLARNVNLQSLRGNPAFESLLSDVKKRWQNNREKFKSGSGVLHGGA
jgi:Flp pilus assembly protein TadD